MGGWVQNGYFRSDVIMQWPQISIVGYRGSNKTSDQTE